MALKANRVGVNPKMVDELGNIKKCEGDYLTVEDIVDSKTSTATNKALSANQGKVIWDNFFNRLRANSKDFKVVYISDLDKYGYQMGTDTPIPFNSGSSATLGINVLEPVTEAITLGANCTIEKGGYQYEESTHISWLDVYIKVNEDITSGDTLFTISAYNVYFNFIPNDKVNYSSPNFTAKTNIAKDSIVHVTGFQLFN